MSEVKISNKLRQTITGFLRQYKKFDLQTPEGALYQCFDTSWDFQTYAKSVGLHVRCVALYGPPDYPRMHPSWRKYFGCGDDFISHCVIVAGKEAVVDFTSKQFDYNAEVPAIYPTIESMGWAKWEWGR